MGTSKPTHTKTENGAADDGQDSPSPPKASQDEDEPDLKSETSQRSADQEDEAIHELDMIREFKKREEQM